MQIGRWETSKEFDYENGFYLTSQPYRLGNILAHYELYKKIIELPGDVIELGVFRGGTLIQFCTFRELLENERSRKIVGFDIFDEFPSVAKVESDISWVENWNEEYNDDFTKKEDIEQSLHHKKIENVELVKGDILETVDEYLKREPHTRIALLHIDTDVYEPSKHGLEKLFDRVVKGGIIAFDDYATVEGETLAVEEFLKKYDYDIRKFRFSHTKPSFIIKK